MAKVSVKDETELIKSEIESFRGGKSINLDKDIDGQILRDKLSSDIGTWLEDAIRSQTELVADLGKWNRQYQGKKDEKTFPYPGAANVAIPTTRSRVDAILVRIFERVFGQMRVFIIKAKDAEFVDMAFKLEEGLDWWAKGIAKLKSKLHSPLLQAIKTGTGIVKLVWKRIPRTTYINTEGDKPPEKKVITEYDGPDVEGIKREDFIISSDATSIEDAFLVGHRIYLRRPEIEKRIKLEIYDSNTLDRIAPEDYDETKKDQAKATGMILEDGVHKPYILHDLWFEYDVDGDGMPDSINITFHRATGTIVRAIYNPFFNSFRPFIAFKPYPREFVFDGEGGCEILESLQEEIDSIHNQRLDRMTQINNPYIFAKAGLNLPDYTRAPGKIIEVEEDISESSLRVEPTSDVYPSTWNEEASLKKEADEAMGVSPEVMGMPSSERPVYREAMARLGEANKKFMYLSDNVLDGGMAVLGRRVLEMIAQYAPEYKYYVKDQGQGAQQAGAQQAGGEQNYKMKTIEFPLEYLWDSVVIELAAAKEIMNQTTRREVNTEMYGMLSDAGQKLIGMAQAITSGQLPMALAPYVMRWAKVAEKLLERIMRDFNQPDAEMLVVKMDEQEIQQAMQEMQQQQQMMAQQAQAAEQGQGSAPQGQPQQ